MAAISTGELCKRIHVTVSPEFLKNLGVTPAKRPADKRAGVFWFESDIPEICTKLATSLTETGAEAAKKLPQNDDEI